MSTPISAANPFEPGTRMWGQWNAVYGGGTGLPNVSTSGVAGRPRDQANVPPPASAHADMPPPAAPPPAVPVGTQIQRPVQGPPVPPIRPAEFGDGGPTRYILRTPDGRERTFTSEATAREAARRLGYPVEGAGAPASVEQGRRVWIVDEGGRNERTFESESVARRYARSLERSAAREARAESLSRVAESGSFLGELTAYSARVDEGFQRPPDTIRGHVAYTAGQFLKPFAATAGAAHDIFAPERDRVNLRGSGPSEVLGAGIGELLEGRRPAPVVQAEIDRMVERYRRNPLRLADIGGEAAFAVGTGFGIGTAASAVARRVPYTVATIRSTDIATGEPRALWTGIYRTAADPDKSGVVAGLVRGGYRIPRPSRGTARIPVEEVANVPAVPGAGKLTLGGPAQAELYRPWAVQRLVAAGILTKAEAARIGSIRQAAAASHASDVSLTAAPRPTAVAMREVDARRAERLYAASGALQRSGHADIMHGSGVVQSYVRPSLRRQAGGTLDARDVDNTLRARWYDRLLPEGRRADVAAERLAGSIRPLLGPGEKVHVAGRGKPVKEGRAVMLERKGRPTVKVAEVVAPDYIEGGGYHLGRPIDSAVQKAKLSGADVDVVTLRRQMGELESQILQIRRAPGGGRGTVLGPDDQRSKDVVRYYWAGRELAERLETAGATGAAKTVRQSVESLRADYRQLDFTKARPTPAPSGVERFVLSSGSPRPRSPGSTPVASAASRVAGPTASLSASALASSALKQSSPRATPSVSFARPSPSPASRPSTTLRTSSGTSGTSGRSSLGSSLTSRTSSSSTSSRSSSLSTRSSSLVTTRSTSTFLGGLPPAGSGFEGSASRRSEGSRAAIASRAFLGGSFADDFRGFVKRPDVVAYSPQAAARSASFERALAWRKKSDDRAIASRAGRGGFGAMLTKGGVGTGGGGFMRGSGRGSGRRGLRL